MTQLRRVEGIEARRHLQRRAAYRVIASLVAVARASLYFLGAGSDTTRLDEVGLSRVPDGWGSQQPSGWRTIRYQPMGSTMPPENKRQEERTVIALPLSHESGTGVTRNVAATGLFFWTDNTRAFAVGDRVNITLEVVKSGRKIKPKCQGEIVRVETRGTEAGVAVRLLDSAIDVDSK